MYNNLAFPASTDHWCLQCDCCRVLGDEWDYWQGQSDVEDDVFHNSSWFPKLLKCGEMCGKELVKRIERQLKEASVSQHVIYQQFLNKCLIWLTIVCSSNAFIFVDIQIQCILALVLTILLHARECCSGMALCGSATAARRESPAATFWGSSAAAAWRPGRVVLRRRGRRNLGVGLPDWTDEALFFLIYMPCLVSLGKS